ncbi:glycoprotein hormone alpha-2 [Acipenser oxyrinchus oxyrinchus]|uniref:Glycoprotein hormone alpha-2 n=1 Tax=Acipenser oxyrinchus oxyrinchus TaxID=40147 RepID=A0AAD8CNN3_ACIOX|nr:glycoprotein hormone alpha-2 [Acipenser oxyrinchus oxyrinchus]
MSQYLFLKVRADGVRSQEDDITVRPPKCNESLNQRGLHRRSEETEDEEEVEAGEDMMSEGMEARDMTSEEAETQAGGILIEPNRAEPNRTEPPAQVTMLSARTLIAGAFLFIIMISGSWNKNALGPGCHLHSFNVTIRSDRRGTCRGTHVAQACVGFCESSAFPSKYSVLLASNFQHNITSVSQCCTISKMQKMKVRLHCEGARREEMEIYTAEACQCDMCRLSRY